MVSWFVERGIKLSFSPILIPRLNFLLQVIPNLKIRDFILRIGKLFPGLDVTHLTPIRIDVEARLRLLLAVHPPIDTFTVDRTCLRGASYGLIGVVLKSTL